MRDGSGRYCTRPRGWGTDHPGYGNCKLHSGSTPSGGKAAAKERTLGDIGRLMADMHIDTIDHHQGLLHAAHRTWRMVGALEVLVSELDAAVGPDHQDNLRPHPLVQMLGEWTDRQARISKLALDAGINEREARLNGELGALAASAVIRLLDAVELGLSAEQREVGRRLAGGIFRELVETTAVVREEVDV